MNLLEALNSITQKDLDDVVGKIGTLEAELDQLKELRKVIEIRLGIRKPLGAHLRGKGRPRKSKDETSEAETSDPGEPGAFRSPSGGGQYTATERHRIEARKFLMANGPTKQAALAHRCGIPAGSITAVLKHEWFTHTSRGVELTRSLKAEPS